MGATLTKGLDGQTMTARVAWKSVSAVCGFACWTPAKRTDFTAGVAEVILYFNYGQKPHGLVKEQMERFMKEIAPHFSRPG